MCSNPSVFACCRGMVLDTQSSTYHTARTCVPLRGLRTCRPMSGGWMPSRSQHNQHASPRRLAAEQQPNSASGTAAATPGKPPAAALIKPSQAHAHASGHSAHTLRPNEGVDVQMGSPGLPPGASRATNWLHKRQSAAGGTGELGAARAAAGAGADSSLLPGALQLVPGGSSPRQASP